MPSDKQFKPVQATASRASVQLLVDAACQAGHDGLLLLDVLPFILSHQVLDIIKSLNVPGALHVHRDPVLHPGS